MLVDTYKFARPLPLTVADLRAWYDLSDTASVTQVSNAISQIADKSGNNNHLNQSTAGSKPTWGTDATTGFKKATFDGTDDAVIATDSASLDLDTGIGIFVACNVLTSGNANRVLVTKDSGAALAFNGYTIRTDGAGSNLTAFIGGSAFANIMGHPYSGRHVFSFEYDKVTVRGRKDLAAFNSAAYTSNVVTNALDLWVGARNAASTALNFELFEMIIYGTDPASGVRDSIESYLKTKWSTV